MMMERSWLLLLLGVPHAMAPSSRRPHVGLGQATLEMLYVEGKGSVVSLGVCGWGQDARYHHASAAQRPASASSRGRACPAPSCAWTGLTHPFLYPTYHHRQDDKDKHDTNITVLLLEALRACRPPFLSSTPPQRSKEAGGRSWNTNRMRHSFRHTAPYPTPQYTAQTWYHHGRAS